MYYIYYCQAWNEVKDGSARQSDPRQPSRKYVLLRNTAGRQCGLALKGGNEFDEVWEALKGDAPVILKQALETMRDKNRLSGMEVTFLLHLGGMNEEECRAATARMNASQLPGAYFLAVSCTNHCPEEIWKDGKLNLPNDETVARIVQEWSSEASGSAANTCHLRTIALLCQALLQPHSPEAHPEAKTTKWWQDIIWGKEKFDNLPEDHRWSAAETAIQEQNDCLKSFCQTIAAEASHFEITDVELKDVVEQLAKTL